MAEYGVKMSNQRVAIVGAGLGGLLLAGRLSSASIPVTVLEKNDVVGGYNCMIEINGRPVPLIYYKGLGLDEDSGLVKILRKIGGSGFAGPRRMRFCDHIYFQDQEFRVPGDAGAFQKLLSDSFPSEKAAIAKAFGVFHDVYATLKKLSDLSFGRDSLALVSKVRAYQATTYQDFLDGTFESSRLKAILSARVFSSTNSLSTMAAYLGKILIDGLYAIPGSGSALSSCLAKELARIPDNVIRTGFEVDSLLFDESGKVRGLRSREGEELACEFVALDCDLKRSLEAFFPNPELIAPVKSALSKAKPSLSAINIIFLVDRRYRSELDRYAETARIFYTEREDLFDVFRSREAARLDFDCLKINIDLPLEESEPIRMYLEVDCSEGALDFVAMANNEKQHLAPHLASLQSKLERIFPGFQKNLIDYEVFTPYYFAKWSGNQGGACSGWNDDKERPFNVERFLAPHNVHVVGQWSMFGTGLSQLDRSAQAVASDLRRKLEIRHS